MVNSVMSADPEIVAMGVVATTLEGLDESTRRRVLAWAASRFGEGKPTLHSSALVVGRDATRSGDFADFPELYHAVDPKTDAHKALTAGYWLQVLQNAQDFGSQPANDLLKNVGYGVGNITRALDGLQALKPALARQVQKSGKSKQARKRYRVTTEGVRTVESMLRPKPEDEA
jgi:hypothetical protein